LFWSYGEYELVGHGKQTNSGCGKFLGFRGCARVDLHNMITLDGVNYSGKVFVQKVHCTCHKPTCPVCYKHGWAVREAKRIEARLSECSKRFGQVEHIIVSVPQRDYGLSLEALRHKVVQKIMKKTRHYWRSPNLSRFSLSGRICIFFHQSLSFLVFN